MKLFTSHSALSTPLLSHIAVDPAVLKQVSRIDRLGNLTPRNITVSPLFADLAHCLSQGKGATVSGLSSEMHWEVCNHIRDLVLQRQQLLIGLVPLDSLELVQDFFGFDTTKQHPSLLVASDTTSADADHLCLLVQTIGPTIAAQEIPSLKDFFPLNQTLAESDATHQNIQDYVPVALSPSAWCQTWCHGTSEQQSLIRQAFNGVDSVSISSKNYAALKKGNAGLIPSSRIYRAFRSPKFWAYAVVFIYSSLRALPVTFVPHFHGSILLLWSMDVLTAIPYTWGLLAFVTAHQWWLRYTGLIVTLVTFMAPYIYFWTHGRHYPPEVTLIVVVMIVGAFAWETFNYLRDVAVKCGLQRKTSVFSSLK